MIEELKNVIAFLDAIPDEQWCVKTYVANDCGRPTGYCALGHLYNRPDSYFDTPFRGGEGFGLGLSINTGFIRRLFDYTRKYELSTPGFDIGNVTVYKTIPQVNDGLDSDYPQATPKLRVIAFLTDIIALIEADQAKLVADQLDTQATLSVNLLLEEVREMEAELVET